MSSKRRSKPKKGKAIISNVRLMSGDATVPIGALVRTGFPSGNYRFKHTYGVSGLVITSNNVTTQLGGFSVQFSDLPSASTWSSLFDRYCIHGAKVEFRPYSNQNWTGVTSIGTLHTAVDFDDATAPATIAAVERYGTYAGVTGNQPLVRHFKPRVAVAVYRTGVSSGYAESATDVWLDMATTDIPHYGVKYALETTSTSAMFTYQVFVTLDVEVAGLR